MDFRREIEALTRVAAGEGAVTAEIRAREW